MATDAFGRLRVSNPSNIFDYFPSALTGSATPPLDVDQWVNTTSGTGAIAYDSTYNYVKLTCSANSDIATVSSKLPMTYQPGKSRLIYMTSIPLSRVNSGSETLSFKIGIFSLSGNNPQEGHYFETNGTSLYWVYCYGGTPTQVIQSSWNIDTFDGTGPSGLTLTASNTTKNMLFVIDQEWLGVGRVRVGFNLNGVNYYAHQFIPNLTYAYTTTPLLPLSYQLSATSIGSSIFSGKICATCVSEGGYTPLGTKIAVGTSIAGVNVSDSGTKYVILGLKIGSSFPTGIIKILGLDMLYPGGSTTKWATIELQLHSTNGSIGALSSTPSFTQVSHSITQLYTGPSSGTAISVTTDGYILTRHNILQSEQIYFNSSEYDTLLTRMQLSKYDTLYIVGTANTANQTIIASLEFIEKS